MVLNFITPLPSNAKKEIQEHLEDQGFGDCIVNRKERTLTVPDLYRKEVDIIASIVSQAGDYKLDIVLDDIVDTDGIWDGSDGDNILD